MTKGFSKICALVLTLTLLCGFQFILFTDTTAAATKQNPLHFIASTPAHGAKNVAPNLTQIKLIFDKNVVTRRSGPTIANVSR